jgi:hypothetical protein
MANSFFDAYERMLPLATRENEFRQSVQQQELDREMRRKALEDEQLRFSKSHDVALQQLQYHKDQLKSQETKDLLSMFSGGTARESPTTGVLKLPTSEAPAYGESPNGNVNRLDRSYNHLVNELTVNDTPVQNAFWYGGKAVSPTTPMERATEQIGLQERIAASQVKQLKSRASQLFEGDEAMQHMYVALEGDMDKLARTPESALSAMILGQKDVPFHSKMQVLGRLVKDRMQARVNPWTAMLAQSTLADRNFNRSSNNILGEVEAAAQADPAYQSLDASGKTQYIRRKMAEHPAVKANPALLGATSGRVDDTQALPSVPKPGLLDSLIQQGGFALPKK